MNPTPPHFIIEEGPERGRELTIPPEGARIGRAEENDITLADAAMSRFQCRVYFREGFLQVMDLGSTNETLVNDEVVSDQPLRHGDNLLIGESLLRVVNDGLSGKAPPAEGKTTAAELEVEPAPIIFQPEVGEGGGGAEEAPKPAPIPEGRGRSKATTVSHAEEEVDLGLGRREEGGNGEEAHAKTNYLLISLVTVLVVMVVGVVFLFLNMDTEPVVTHEADEDAVRVYYEKVIARDGNIYRYAAEVSPEGEIYAEIHDLEQQRDIIRRQEAAERAFDQFKNQVLTQRDTFGRLRSEYEGVAGGEEHESYDLTLVTGREVNRVRVVNQMEPDAFQSVRESVEAFVDSELDLGILNQPPEVLRREAARAWENARKLYAERDVRNRNLWEAIQQLRQVEWLLETVEPKPEYYREAVRLQDEWWATLRSRIEDLDFQGMRAYNLGNLERAADMYRRILATLPERSHRLHIQAQQRLITIEQELN